MWFWQMVFQGRLLHLFQEHLFPLCLCAALCIGSGAAIGLLHFFHAERYAIVADVRKRAVWIAAVSGGLISCGIVLVFDLAPNALIFAGFMVLGAAISGGSGLLPITFALPALRRAAGNSKERRLVSHHGKERLKD